MGDKVLLIEDDAAIGTMLTLALREWGYDVLYASKAAAAVEIARAYGSQIGVALCDIVLPDGPSPAVSEAIRGYCPGVWLIYTSGYPLDILADRGSLPMATLQKERTGFLPKPFLPSDVRDAIGCALLTTLEKPETKTYAASAY
jgi:DNA-binding NtrC family response regulator